MRCVWVLLMCLLSISGSFETVKDLWQEPHAGPSKSSFKNSKPPRHKQSRHITNHPPRTVPNSDNAQDILDHFPDVIYPTSILEAAQPFYFSPSGFDDVLGPFSSDVKSSYKSLTTGRGKSLTHNHTSLLNNKTAEKTNDKPVLVNLTANTISDLENQGNSSTNDEMLFASNTTSNEINSESIENAIIEDYNLKDNNIKDYNENNKNLECETTYGVNNDSINENNSFSDESEYSNLESLEDNLLGFDVANINDNSYLFLPNDTLDLSNEIEIINVDEDVMDIINLTHSKGTHEDLLEANTEVFERSNNTRTIFLNITPDNVITSDSNNNHEDFVNDILNIYSLIEESIRAISVVEFVVSKTLNALGLENQNGTMTSMDTFSNSSASELIENNTALFSNSAFYDDLILENMNSSTEIFSG